MKIPVNSRNFSYICDNSLECDANSAFLISPYTKQYLEDAKNRGSRFFLTLKDIKDLFRLDNSLKIVGVVGTNGKTTTASAIYSLLLDASFKVALQGTRGFFVNDKLISTRYLTTPFLLENIWHMKIARDSGCNYFIMEVSSHAIEQGRVDLIDFELKIFTNITSDHLDYHKTLENYIRVKNSFFQDNTKKLINIDDANIKFNPKNIYTYSVFKRASFCVLAYEIGKSLKAVLLYKDKNYMFESPLIGIFNLYNILAAISSVKILTNLDLEQICSLVPLFGGVRGRMEIVSKKPFIIVDYAHTADGMKSVFEAIKRRDIVVIFGAGGNRDVTKRAFMGKVAENYAKKIYITSDNPRNEHPQKIADDIIDGISNKDKIIVELDRLKAIKRAIKESLVNDTILVLGKGDEEFQEIGGKKIPLNDRDVIEDALMNLKIIT